MVAAALLDRLLVRRLPIAVPAVDAMVALDLLAVVAAAAGVTRSQPGASIGA